MQSKPMLFKGQLYNYNTVSKPLYTLIQCTEFIWILSVCMHSWGWCVVLYNFYHVSISITTTITIQNYHHKDPLCFLFRVTFSLFCLPQPSLTLGNH